MESPPPQYEPAANPLEVAAASAAAAAAAAAPVQKVADADQAKPAASPAATKPASARVPPPGYKFVKVRMPDGTIKTAKKKLAPGEAPPSPKSAEPKKKDEAAADDGTQTKVVLARMPDGSIKKVKRAVKPEDEAKTDGAKSPKSPTSPKSPKSPKSPMSPTSPTSSTGKVSLESETKAKMEEAGVSPTDQPVARSVGDGDVPAPSAELEAALAEQQQNNRSRRMTRFKNQMIRGLATVVGSSIPALEITDFHHDDQAIDDDDDDDGDWDDDDDDNGHGADDDVEEFDEHLHSGADEDHAASHGDDNDGPHFNFDATAAINGTLQATAANLTARAAPGQQQQQGQPGLPQAPQPAAQPPKKGEKVTFVAGEKELKEMDEKLESAADEKHRKLQRHWANISFVILASLTVILPGLFIVLGIMIWLMDNKSTSSRWQPMEDAIKVSVSAWPIVFAAVVAQCFKAWATYRVERGIKLMELEQLIGSNSFSSAMKQPIMLRNLNFLTLGLIAVWCLSPLGSQALQRVYVVGPLRVDDTVQIAYLDTTGANAILGVNTTDITNSTSPEAIQDQQLAAVYYLSTFLPASTRDKTLPKQDRFDNPHIPDIANKTLFTKTSKYGVPLSLPSPVMPGKWNQPAQGGDGSADDEAHVTSAEENKEGDEITPDPDFFEKIEFTIRTSYFKLKCNPWETKSGGELYAAGYYFSWSTTLGVAMTNPANDSDAPMTQIQFASRNHKLGQEISRKNITGESTGSEPEWDDAALYSAITCNITQVFVDVPMKCERKQLQHYLVPDCDAELNEMTLVSPDDVEGTDLADISRQWVDSGSIYTEGEPITPVEIFLDGSGNLGTNKVDYTNLTLSDVDRDPSKFEELISQTFNSFVGLGYCPRCYGRAFIGGVAPNDTDLQGSRWGTVQGHRSYSNTKAYQVSWPWLAFFFVCAGTLLMAGVAAILVEGRTVAPDVLGYVSTVARNSKYLKLPKTHSYMSGGERLQELGKYKVMMQDVKANADVGRIALGLKHDKAQRLQAGRVYR